MLTSGAASAQLVTININLPKLTWPSGRSAPVQIQLPPARAALKNVFPPGYDAAEACQTVKIDGNGYLNLTWPARFPNAEKQEVFMADYRLNCPNFTIEHLRYKSLTVRGLSLPQLVPLLESNGREQPYLMLAYDTVIEVGEGNNLLATTYKDEAPRKELVVVARQAGRDPVALVFNGAEQPFSFDPAQALEVYQKANSSLFWGRMVYNHNERLIHFDREYPFPYK